MGYCSIFQHAKPASALGELFAEEDQQLQRQLSRQQQSPPTIRERLEKEITVLFTKILLISLLNMTLPTGGVVRQTHFP